MTPALVVALGATMVGTSLLSGVFGMAGGLILVGVLLALMPLPDAMALHAVTQMASNGWRGLLWWQHVRWPAVAAYALGCAAAMGLWSVWRWVPEKPVALLLLGLSPFAVRLLPRRAVRDPDSTAQGAANGLACMTLMLLTGVAGPLLDSFFLGGGWDRRQIVATKAACQVIGHGLKLLYFSAVVAQTATLDPALAGLAVLCSMLGTTLARRLLEAMSDAQFRRWAGHLITAIAGYYVAHGTWLLLGTP